MPSSDVKRPWLLACLFVVIGALSGCAAVMQQLDQMATLSKCRFRLASVEKVTLVGIPLQGSASQIGLGNIIRLQQAFATGTLPLSFTLDVEVKNPNASVAGMSRMEWSLFLDGNPLAAGVVEQALSVPPNDGVGTLPLAVGLDLKKVFSGRSLDSMVDLAKTVAGEGAQPTRLTLQVKPSMTVGGRTVPYPGTLTVTHEFGAK